MGIPRLRARRGALPRGPAAFEKAGKTFELGSYSTGGGSRVRRTHCLNQKFRVSGGFSKPPEKGRRTVTEVPAPGADSSEIEPPWRSTMCLTIERPSPVPPVCLERDLSTR